MDLNGASSNSSSSSSLGSHICLMARDSNVTPSLKPTISSDNEEEDDDVASLRKKGEIDKDHTGDPMEFCPDLSQRVYLDRYLPITPMNAT
jgi:hypothetical protein